MADQAQIVMTFIPLDIDARVEMRLYRGGVATGIIVDFVWGGHDRHGAELPVRAIVEWDQRRRGLKRMVPVAKLRRVE